MKKLKITLLTLLLTNLVLAQSNSKYLRSILKNIDQIKSASFTCELTAGEANEEIPYRSFRLYYKMYADPNDIYCGASFLSGPIDKKNEYNFCYDGQFRIELDWKKRIAQIDTLSNESKRPLAPFFMKAKSVINYALENIDSTIISLEEYNDSTKIIFLFEGKRVELGRLIPHEKIVPNENSQYELWIDRRTNLPFNFIRKMAHQKSTERCYDIRIETTGVTEFDAFMQIPVDFTIKGRKKRKVSAYELDGKQAPNWKLDEVNGKNFSLESLKSKIILIEFTSIGCGPCHQAIPLLNKLSSEHKRKDLEVVSIEIVSKKAEALKRYTEKMELNYKYLIGNDITKKRYKVTGMPTFFILDENRVVRKVIYGYRKGVTDQEIINSIDNLL